jgi:hypothetical protein
MEKIKSYVEKQNAVIWLNGKKTNYEIDVEVCDIPLGELINLYLKLKNPKWYTKLFDSKYFYYKYSLQDIEATLNTFKLHVDYKYLKKTNLI